VHKQYSAETCSEYYILVAEERGLAVKEARSCCNYITNQGMVMMMCIFLQASIAIEKMCYFKDKLGKFL
jgi:hypothetical protein